MTNFIDGPAKGQTLMLRRAPFFLRVVRDDTHAQSPKWDALDAPTDTPLRSESVYAYQLTAKPGYVHLNTGCKPGGGVYRPGSYKLCAEQPTSYEARNVRAWQQWCEARKHWSDAIA